MIDQAVVDGVRDGDPGALAQVHRHVRPKLTNWLAPQVRDRALAEDIISEAFIKLLRRHDTIYGGPEQLTSWLYQTTYRTFLDHLRHRQRRPDEELGDVPEHAGSVDPFDVAAALDELRQVNRRLQAALTESQMAVVVLMMAGLNQVETGERLGMSRDAVNGMMIRARRNLTRTRVP